MLGVLSEIEDALRVADETKALTIGNGVLSQLPQLFKEQFPGKAAIIVADTNTYRVAGREVGRLLQEAGIKQEKNYIGYI